MKRHVEGKSLWNEFQILCPGGQAENFVVHLAQRGFSKMECIKALNEATGCGISEANKLVHFSPAFEYRRVSDEAFLDDCLQTLEQIANEGKTMTNQPLRPRAAALIFNDQRQILLMLRRKDGNAYATLPGGGIESGETPAQACAREVLEEVNLVVEVGDQVLLLDNLNNREHYFLTSIVSGEMQLGAGPEALRQSDENWYQPEWIDLDRLDKVNLVPEQVCELVQKTSRKMP